MKKILMLGVLALGLTACGGSTSEQASQGNNNSKDLEPPVIDKFTASNNLIHSEEDVTLIVNASDNNQVSQISLKYDGVVFATSKTSTYTFSRHFTSSDNGMHVITALAEDLAGNKTAKSIYFNVAISTTVPTAPTPNHPSYPRGFKPPCVSPYLIKGNVSSTGERIYHVPGGTYYSRTDAEVCFITEGDAQADGFRKSSR